MKKQLKAKVASISNEVDEFHPLLQTILPKLPNVNNTDYTHGANEKGADFVLTRYDETFGDIEYIGVIAKIGKIKQDTADIDRQIEECELERYTGDGKKQIFLSEIWVISNDTITSNAKEKIHHKYSTRKIKFINQSRLIDLIEKYAPNYWADIPLQIGEYLQYINTRNAEIEERTTLLPFANKSLYIDQTIEKIDNRKYTQKRKKMKKPLKEDVLKVLDRDFFIIIEGGMGSGKSKLIRWIVDHLSDPEVFEKTNLQPIPISYKELQENFLNDISTLIRTTNKKHKLPETDRKYLVLIDGIDETQQKLSKRVDSILDLYEQTKNDKTVKVLIASRPIDHPDLEARLSDTIHRYDLSPLTTTKVINFIEAICSELNIKTRIIEDLKKSPLFRSLPRTPIAAILLAKLLNENLQDLPSNMTELYTKYMELSLGRWDIEKGLQSQKEFEALMAIITNISVYMLDNELYEMSAQESKEFFQKYLGQRNLGINIDSLFNMLVNRCDVISFDERNKTIAFKHKTFAEYFYARSLTRKRKVSISEDIYDLYWMNMYFFYIGLKRDCPDLLKEVVNVMPSADNTKILRMINLGNFLLAGYSTPYNVITEGIKSVFMDATEFYHDLTSNTTSSPLSKIPAMHLLALLRTILHDSYSYNFFYNAIEEALLIADDLDIADSKKALLLFLLDVAYVEVGGASVFDTLIDKFGPDLPIPIQLAIHHESEFLNIKTNAIKKMEKRLKRSLKKSRSLQNTLDNLYNRPISSLSIT